jgi:bifunctional DNA-binding transcriptional regulator/antitoxin component of YhaV-PrlF toxin-antitoxin module
MPKRVNFLAAFEEGDLFELRVSSAGHVVLPEELRTVLGIRVGDRLFLTMQRGHLVLLRPEDARTVVRDGLKL